MSKYELVIIWETGERETATYNTREEAEEHENGYFMAFGNQISFMCVNQVRG
jgi:LAS superfamily LD-carboxypeptidase LdcB